MAYTLIWRNEGGKYQKLKNWKTDIQMLFLLLDIL